ncbi:MAG: glycosyltransferase, partial [Candidatus Sumerlaeota bacterium]|nr:glycosyltransferase [Candidatus Sumerlaeota bacterium]
RSEKIRFLSGLSCFSEPATHPDSKGQPMAEALAAGTPVVLPDSGCFPEWIQATQGGLLFPAGDSAALAAAVARLMKEPELGRVLGSAGRRAIRERFTIERMAQATIAALKSFSVAV